MSDWLKKAKARAALVPGEAARKEARLFEGHFTEIACFYRAEADREGALDPRIMREIAGHLEIAVEKSEFMRGIFDFRDIAKTASSSE